MRIAVNLATKPFADLGPALKRLRIGMGTLALVAIALGLALHFMHNQAEAARAREHALDSSIAKINQERQQAQVMVHQPDNAAVLDQVSALNRLIDTKAFSWTLAMEDLESVLPGGVQVTTLEPIVDKKDGHITVRMRVAGARDKAVQLVSNLEHSRHFLQPRITGESAEGTGNSAQQQVEPVSMSSRVTFDLLADYNPVSAGERKAPKKAEQGTQGGEAGPHAPATATPRTGSSGRQRTPYARSAKPAQLGSPNHPTGGPR